MRQSAFDYDPSPSEFRVIFLGVDDTDLEDTPGTNQLARHLVTELKHRWRGHMITRHQLLDDPRVPCTRKNGCVAIAFDADGKTNQDELVQCVESIMRAWCPNGSDPGLAATCHAVPEAVIRFGQRCQTTLVTQADARSLAAAHGIYLQGLGGTEDGVIGALAAMGLIYSRNDGRVIFNANAATDHFDVRGVQSVCDLPKFGIDQVLRSDNQQAVVSGCVDLGKRLRPNLRDGRVVLFVSPSDKNDREWLADRVL